MKKLLVSSFVLLALLALTTGTVFAGSVINLIGVSNGGGGPTFTFRVNGEFTQSELNSGSVIFNGESVKLSCNQTDETTVVCHAARKVSGEDVVVNFGGSKFWAGVPEAREPRAPQQYCYAVYDYLSLEEFHEGYWQWMDRGQTCQDVPAAEGDWHWDYSWAYEDWTWFSFYENGIDDAPYGPGDPDNWSNPGAGYYLEHHEN